MNKRRIKVLSSFVAVILALALCPAVALAQQGSSATQLQAGSSVATQADSIASGTWGTCPWEVSADGTLTVHAGTGSGSMEVPWADYKDSIKKVVFAIEDGQRLKFSVACIC